MARPKFVQIPPSQLQAYEPLLGDGFARVEAAAAAAREHFRGRAIWNINSTMRGGGVAEMLHSLLPYLRGAGIDARWVVLRERAEFFDLTKRLHNHLHGAAGDGGPLGDEERALYEHCLATSARHLANLVQPGDLVFLHDPQTAGLVEQVKAAGATVVWRCHIGCDEPNQLALAAQDFLHPYLRDADAWVSSRDAYIWTGFDRARCWTMAPSIDPFSPKNQELGEPTVAAILGEIGLGDHAPGTAPCFTRADGSPGRVERSAELIQEARLPASAPLLAQISRWDRLKDHGGLLECFAQHLPDGGLHLLLAGPASGAIADDPEASAVWEEVHAAWRGLEPETRRRVHLANLPLDDLDENGAVVNAIQRRATIVAQKSIAEGFGLTVAEAMWKGKPVVGGRVGGIQDQISDGVDGLLVDPTDLGATARAIEALLHDPERAAQLGERARERVREHFLGATRLAEYMERLVSLEQLDRAPS